MNLDTAIAISEAIEGQVDLIWTASLALAAALAVVVRSRLRTKKEGGAIWRVGWVLAGLSGLAALASLVCGYVATNALVTLIREAGTNADVKKIDSLMGTIELFAGFQLVGLLVQFLTLIMLFAIDPRAREGLTDAATPGP